MDRLVQFTSFLYLYWKTFQKETHCFPLPLPLSSEDNEHEEVPQQWFGSPKSLRDQHVWSSLVFAASFQLAEVRNLPFSSFFPFIFVVLV